MSGKELTVNHVVSPLSDSYQTRQSLTSLCLTCLCLVEELKTSLVTSSLDTPSHLYLSTSELQPSPSADISPTKSAAGKCMYA